MDLIIVSWSKPCIAILTRKSVLTFSSRIMTFFTDKPLRIPEGKTGVRIVSMCVQIKQSPAVHARLTVFLLESGVLTLAAVVAPGVSEG